LRVGCLWTENETGDGTRLRKVRDNPNMHTNEPAPAPVGPVTDLPSLLDPVIAAAEREGERLAAEFFRKGGPRGRHSSAPVDLEMETALRAALQALVPCRFVGEESGETQAPAGAAARGLAEWVWLVDPHDGTYEFLRGRRGSAVSVALLRAGVPVLAVVHSPLAPDVGRDTIAWVEGGAGLVRNGRPIVVDLARRGLASGERVLASASAAFRPGVWTRAVAPAEYVALPSIAYRLARVAAGDAIATLTVHPVNEYDIAAGHALVRAAGGVVMDAAGLPLALKGEAEGKVSGCIAGAPAAVAALARFDWKALDQESRAAARLDTMTERVEDEARLARAQGALLGMVLGDGAAGALHAAKQTVLLTARALLRGEPARLKAAAGDAAALLGVLPLALHALPDWQAAAARARAALRSADVGEERAETAAAFASALALGVAGATAGRMLRGALDTSTDARLRSALRAAASGERPGQALLAGGRDPVALAQNAFFQLLHAASAEAAAADTARAGGDTDLNAALAGALYGAAMGREAWTPGRILGVLARRPMPADGTPLGEAMQAWPDDLLELAEAMIAPPRAADL
jgi:ADP-ribosyl-[dinitrogen reductase] hydrolase